MNNMKHIVNVTNFDKKEWDKHYQKKLNQNLLDSSGKKSALNEMRNLIERGANVNCGDRINETPLMKACEAVFYSGVKLLIEKGADINILNFKDENALIYLASNGNYSLRDNRNSKKILDILINHNIDLNNTSNRLDTTTPNITALDYSSFIKDYIEENYPEKYNEYLMKIKTKKYNL